MFHHTQLRVFLFDKIMQCAHASMPRSLTASLAACWQSSQHILVECNLQSGPPKVYGKSMVLPCTLTYPVVAEVPGEDGRSEGAGRIHPCASVIHLQETQLELRQHPSLPVSLSTAHMGQDQFQNSPQ